MRRWGWFRTRPGHLGKKSLPMWLRALSSAVPWITVFVLFLMIAKIGGMFFLDRGTAIELPDGVGDVMKSHTVAFLFYTDEGALVFFDDTRYMLKSPSQMEKFSKQLSTEISYVPVADANTEASGPVMLLLVDRRVSVEDQMKVVRIARKSGVARVLLAEKKEEVRGE